MSADPAWRPIFGHAEPYDEQVDGIDAAVETAREDGFLALEGACGTGKTMLVVRLGVAEDGAPGGVGGHVPRSRRFA